MHLRLCNDPIHAHEQCDRIKGEATDRIYAGAEFLRFMLPVMFFICIPSMLILHSLSMVHVGMAHAPCANALQNGSARV